MQALPSFIQSLFLYALTTPTSMAIRNGVSLSHDTPKTDTQSAFVEGTKYINFLLELLQSAQREELRRQNMRRLKFGSWVKRKTVLAKFKSKHGHSYFPRASRARLDRMPLAFGKRKESEIWEREIGDVFEREARDRLHRMPLTFGKRIPNEMPTEATSTSEATDVGGVRTLISHGQQIPSRSYDGPPFKRQSNRLTRMPITFGKRTLSHHNMGTYFLGNSAPESRGSADNEKWQEQGFHRDGRTILSRMPLTFGRKKKTVEDQGAPVRHNADRENSLSSQKGDILFVDFIGKLTSGDANEFPMSSLTNVKNEKPDGTNGNIQNDGNLSGISPERKPHEIQSSDMPDNIIEQIAKGYIYPDDAFPVERRTVINRMPLTFGKRSAPDVKLRVQRGRGQQGVDEDKTASGQVREWPNDGQGDRDERGMAKSQDRPRDFQSRMMPDGHEWADAI